MLISGSDYPHMLPPPNPEIEHERAQFQGSECSQAATTPFFAKSSPTAFVLSWPTTSCPLLLPNQAPPPSFCHGQLPPAPVFAKSSIQVLGLAKMNSAALVSSWPTTTCPRFCQIEHLDARFGKNKPHHLHFVMANCHLPLFLPNRAPERSGWQKQAPTALSLSWQTTTCSVFAKSSTWMLGLAKTSPPPTFCHGQPPLAPFLPN